MDEDPIVGEIEVIDVDPGQLEQQHLVQNAVPDDLWD